MKTDNDPLWSDIVFFFFLRWPGNCIVDNVEKISVQSIRVGVHLVVRGGLHSGGGREGTMGG